MSVRLRLRRMGAKKRPFYRIVAIDSKKGRQGTYLDNLGTYNPLLDPPGVTLKETEVISWLEKGAQPSDTVRAILRKSGTFAKFVEKKIQAKKSVHADKT